MIARNDLCWCGSRKKWKKCHHPISGAQSFQELKEIYFKNYQIILKTSEQIEGIRAASRLAASILKKVCAQAKEGVTTEALDDYAQALHREAGAIPASLGYGNPPFPKGICTSLNDVICHGIPNRELLCEGDILNIDVTSILNGYYGDCSAMVTIGEISEEKQRVVSVSYACLMRAIEILKPGIPISKIGEVIEGYATQNGCSVVSDFVAHGIGLRFHESPQIFHCYNTMNIPLTAGMTFTIEPMINAGVRAGKIDSKDQWTVRTLDGKPSAQWEHTLLITDSGSEILTLS